MNEPRIVTLAQLCLLPLGTLVSPVVIEEGRAEFDIQGTLQTRGAALYSSNDGQFLELTGVLPDVKVVDGRVSTSPCINAYSIPNEWHPHRFVVWSTPS